MPRRSLASSFRYAWDGLAEGALRERNLRIHLALGVLAGAFAACAPILPFERAIVVLCVALVVASEAANAAVEAAVDLASPGRDERARIAKDSAAAAVLALSAGSVLVLLAIVAGRAEAFRAAGSALVLPAVGALGTALSALALAWPSARRLAVDVALGFAGMNGLFLVCWGAESLAGAITAALCLAVSAGAAAKRRARGQVRDYSSGGRVRSGGAGGT